MMMIMIIIIIIIIIIITIITTIRRLHRLFKSLDTFLDIVNHVYLQVCGRPFLHITTVATVRWEKFLGKLLGPLD